METRTYTIPPEYRGNLEAALRDDPAGYCPARCDTERLHGHDYVNGVCEYCERVEE